MPELPIGLFPGHFQPFHTGHLLVLKGMAKMCQKVVVAVLEPEAMWTATHPFSLDERKEMLQRSLQEADLIPAFDIYLVPAGKANDWSKWLPNVREVAKGVDRVWTSDPILEQAARDAGLEVQIVKEVPGMSSQEVRRRLKEGGDWKALVPPAVSHYIQEIRAEDRLKALGA